MPLLGPSPSDLDRVEEQWAAADRLARTHVGEGLDQSMNDIGRLQKLIDLGALTASHTYELQCLGIALGRILARHVSGLDWAVVDDEYGRDPTIRFRDSSLQINVLTMISKRVEAGQEVDVRAMYEWACGQVDHLKSQAD